MIDITNPDDLTSLADGASAAEIDRMVEDAFTLVNNNSLVEDLRAALLSGERAHSLVPELLEEVLETKAWLRRRDQNGNVFAFGPGELAEFVSRPAPQGLAVGPEALEKYLGDGRECDAIAGAGLRVKAVGLPLDPALAATVLRRHFTADQLEAMFLLALDGGAAGPRRGDDATNGGAG